MNEEQANKEVDEQPPVEQDEAPLVEQAEAASVEQAEAAPVEQAEQPPVEQDEAARVGQAGIPLPVQASSPSNGMAIAALILGVVSVTVAWFPLISYITAILAIVFGFIGMKNPHQKALAIVGIVLGFLTFILKIGFWILIIIGIASEMMYY